MLFRHCSVIGILIIIRVHRVSTIIVDTFVIFYNCKKMHLKRTGQQTQKSEDIAHLKCHNYIFNV